MLHDTGVLAKAFCQYHLTQLPQGSKTALRSLLPGRLWRFALCFPRPGHLTPLPTAQTGARGRPCLPVLQLVSQLRQER